MAVPSRKSIKGGTIQAVAEDMQRLVDEGRISEAELEARLMPEDLAILEPLGADHSFRVIATEAGEFPEAARYAAQGFIQYIANETAPVELRVTSARETPDRIVYLAEPASSEWQRVLRARTP